jgi:DNA ligase (NAD+)
MYSKEQVIEIQKRTQQLVQANHTEKAFEIVENLRKVLEFHEYRYYVLNDPLFLIQNMTSCLLFYKK